MKIARHLLIISAVFLFANTATANEPRKGYRGFVEANVDLAFTQNGYGNNALTTYYGISTSHGYQFNPHFFLGTGLMFERTHPGNYPGFLQCTFPFFFQARTDRKIGRLPIYADVRIGGVIFGDDRLFISPTVGYRLNLGRKSNLNFGIGINLRGYRWSDEKTFHPQLAIRVGIDF